MENCGFKHKEFYALKTVSYCVLVMCCKLGKTVKNKQIGQSIRGASESFLLKTGRQFCVTANSQLKLTNSHRDCTQIISSEM